MIAEKCSTGEERPAGSAAPVLVLDFRPRDHGDPGGADLQGLRGAPGRRPAVRATRWRAARDIGPRAEAPASQWTAVPASPDAREDAAARRGPLLPHRLHPERHDHS